MGKSIRSKVKRKHRAEFRATIGDVAYKANLEKVQTNMKLCLEKQVLISLDKLSNQLDTSDPNTIVNNSTSTSMMDDDDEDSTTLNRIDLDNNTDTEIINLRGENKVIVNKKPGKKRKHSYAMKAIERKSKKPVGTGGGDDDNNKRTYRFHCKF